MHDSLLHAIDLYLMFVILYLKYIDAFVRVCVCVCVELYLQKMRQE